MGKVPYWWHMEEEGEIEIVLGFWDILHLCLFPFVL
jgi:hypothetical protein